MCGIFGYVGNQKAVSIIIEGLKRLEYRGYDSAGVAVNGKKGLDIRKAEGKIRVLESVLQSNPLDGNTGIGHTRWATHGRPSDINAHPHRAGKIIVVHNGIIENHSKLRKFLEKNGHKFESETDSEVICQLMHYYSTKKGVKCWDAFKKTIDRLEGSFAVVAMSADCEDNLFIAKRQSPMVVGYKDSGGFVASDVPALLPYLKDVVSLEDDEMGIIKKGSVEIYSKDGKKINKTPYRIPWSSSMAEKGGYKHFMLKEIFEQPSVMHDVYSGRINPSKSSINFDELKNFDLKNINAISIIACGTSWHSGLIGRYYFESIANIPTSVDMASEFKYRCGTVNEKTLVISISQSGETADTISAVKLAKKAGVKHISLTNVIGSSIARLSDVPLYIHAGPEIGVASTKAFTAQVSVLLMLALYMSYGIKKNSPLNCDIVDDLLKVPSYMQSVLKRSDDIREVAKIFAGKSHALYMGRGMCYPLALEGALKLKEISYLHAEGFAAGELKHGPIALIEQGLPVVAIAPKDITYDKLMSNMEEVKARGAKVIAVGQSSDKKIREHADYVLYVPKTNDYIAPIVMALPLQLFAYYIADHRGTDVDQPRNLAKSVTVE